ELPGEVAEPAVLAVVVHAADVPVVDLAGQADLGLEAPGHLGVLRDLGTQDLERDRVLERAVPGLVDGAHRARAQRLLDLVAGRDDGAGCERDLEDAAAGPAVRRVVVVRGLAERAGHRLTRAGVSILRRGSGLNSRHDAIRR